jgi:hypothetical protein
MQHWHKGRLYTVDNVEAQVCRECGERYSHDIVPDKINAITGSKHEVMEVLHTTRLFTFLTPRSPATATPSLGSGGRRGSGHPSV